MRELVRKLGGQGRTVFVSSHILPEVQQMCDEAAILTRGRCVAAGPVEEVPRAGRAAGLIVRVPDPAMAREVLGASGTTDMLEDGMLRVSLAPERAADVTKALTDASLYLTGMRSDEVDLETVFLELTGDQER